MAIPIVREHMTPNPITIEASVSVAKAQRLMREHGVHHLPVLSDSKLVGIITFSDILEAFSFDNSRQNPFEVNYTIAVLTVDELMTPDPVTIAPDDTVLEAADLMFQHDIGSLPVVEDSELVGIITNTDIFHLVVRMLAEREGDRS